MNLYENIKKRREELNLSQEELAQKMGYKSKSSISKIEKGKADIPQSKIWQFANVLKIEPSELMGIPQQKEASFVMKHKISKPDVMKLIDKIYKASKIEKPEMVYDDNEKQMLKYFRKLSKENIEVALLYLKLLSEE